MTMSMSAPLSAGASKKMKVLCPVEKPGDKKARYWIRCGTAFVNRDQSINLYIDVLPINGRLHIRELDEDELKDRDPLNPRRRGQQVSLPDLQPANDEHVPF